MNNYYKDFLERLVQYRVQLNLTQEKVGQELGITQSQFSKQELGKTIVPYKVLVKFAGMGWDIDYLFTGRRTVPRSSELTERIEKVEVSQREAILRLAIWALETGLMKADTEMSTEVKCEISILKTKVSGESTKSILHEVRKVFGLPQMAMAEMLGVNIKKYRMLERAQTHPDAELLLEIYETTGCKPSLFMAHREVESIIIDDLWSLLTKNQQVKILSMIELAEEFLGA